MMAGKHEKIGSFILALAILFAQNSLAEEAKKISEVVVKGETEKSSAFLPEVQGTKIYSGKKTSALHIDEIPEITNNNYRQALQKTPGLMLSEETTPLLSIGYRGLAPDRVQYMQVLKDGIPITADMVGYPEAYYTPPFQTIERLEFIRGGSALMYGPQPGGAINFVTRKPDDDTKLRLYSENTFGSDQYFSTYEAATGTVGPMGYYAYIHEREGNGFRLSNSDFDVISSGLKVTLNQRTDSRLTFFYDEYHEEHGEPGGLTLTRNALNPTYEENREFTTRMYDRFRLERYYAGLIHEKEFSDETELDTRFYGGRYRRYSKRQRGGGFGTIPTGSAANSNDIQEQDFYNIGFEPRLRHDYDFLGETHTLTFGTHTFLSHSPRVEQRGSSPFADSGVVRKENYRDLWYLSVFMENLFRFGKLSITPGVRVENIWQHIQEEFNADKTTVPLLDERTHRSVPLFGLGITYEIVKGIEVYSNLSQSYRPPTFADTVPLGTNQVIDADLNEGFAKQYDFGLRGEPLPFFNWDISYFILDFSDQIGTVGNTITNVGDAWHHGVEFSTEADVIGFWDYLSESNLGGTVGSLNPFFNLTVLDAEFDQGPNKGKSPQYTPDYTVRFGINYNLHDRVLLNLLSTFVDDHYADDALTPNRIIPSYKVWDLTGEIVLVKNAFDVAGVSLFGGINNLFDEDYYARITSAGIDPAYGRNFYGGIKINLGLPGEQQLTEATQSKGYGLQ